MVIVANAFKDISTLLELAWVIRRSLHDASDASQDIRKAVVCLDEFTSALQTVHAVLGNGGGNVPDSLQNGIAHALRLCNEPLQGLQSKIASEQRSIEQKYGARVWRGHWAACALTIVGGKEELDTLRLRLTEQMKIVTTMVDALTGSAKPHHVNPVEDQPEIIRVSSSPLRPLRTEPFRPAAFPGAMGPHSRTSWDEGIPTHAYFQERSPRRQRVSSSHMFAEDPDFAIFSSHALHLEMLLNGFHDAKPRERPSATITEVDSD